MKSLKIYQRIEDRFRNIHTKIEFGILKFMKKKKKFNLLIKYNIFGVFPPLCVLMCLKERKCEMWMWLYDIIDYVFWDLSDLYDLCAEYLIA